MKTPPATGGITLGFGATPGPDEIDWGKLTKEFEVAAAAALAKFRDLIEREWREKASAQFSNETTDEYLKGLDVSISGDGVTATISGWKPTALEGGVDPFDMKPGLLQGYRKRIIRMRNGNFRTVSTNSDPQSWWHPGIEARKIGEQVKKEENSLKEKAFGSMLAKFAKRIDI